MSAQPGSMDFSELSKQASQALDSPVEPVKIAESEVKPDPVPSPGTIASSEPTANVSEEVKSQQIFDIPEDAQVKVKIDGKEEIVNYKDYKDSLQREAVFTKRQQALAKQREEAEQFYVQKYAELVKQAEQVQAYEQMLKNQSQPIEQLVNALKPQEKQKSPDEILTYGELQQELQRQQQTFEQQLLLERAQQYQVQQDSISQLEQKRLIEGERKQYFDGLNKLLDHPEYKVLEEVIPDFRGIVQFNVRNMGPQNLAEALQFSEAFVKERAETLKKLQIAESQKVQAAKVAAKLETPEGVPPLGTKQAKPVVFDKKGRLDWNALTKEAHRLAASMAD